MNKQGCNRQQPEQRNEDEMWTDVPHLVSVPEPHTAGSG